MTAKLEIAAIVTVPGWLVCVQLHYQDELRAWWRRARLNRAIRRDRRADRIAVRRHRALTRMVGGRQL